MGFLFGKSFKTTKFKRIVTLAISRVAQLKNQHHVRRCQARSDVIQLLSLGQHESALLRVDHVIREQNVLDAFAIIEDYCRLLIERIALISHSKACPDELKEAISSLIFAASRYGELPELQKINKVFISKYGKQFVNDAVELRIDCGVNPKMAKKFPTRRPSLGTRTKMLKEIAAENEIVLSLEGEHYVVTEEKLDAKDSKNLHNLNLKDYTQNLSKEVKDDEEYSAFTKAQDEYKDITTAAQAAFELAAQAGAAARAAILLSQSKLQENDPDKKRSFSDQKGKVFNLGESSKSKPVSEEIATSEGIKQCQRGHEVDTSSKTKGEHMAHNDRSYNKEIGIRNIREIMKKLSFDSVSDSDVDKERQVQQNVPGVKKSWNVMRGFDNRIHDKKKRLNELSCLEHDERVIDEKYSSLANEVPIHWHSNTVRDEESFENENELQYPSPAYSLRGKTVLENIDDVQSIEHMAQQYLNRGRKPGSVRTRRTHKL